MRRPVSTRTRRPLGAVPRADARNLLQCSGEAALQTVFHVHLHAIPRYAGDQRDRLGQQWTPVHTPGDPERIAEVAARLA